MYVGLFSIAIVCSKAGNAENLDEIDLPYHKYAVRN